MGEIVGPLYEVTHTLDPDIVADFDQWLADHVDEMLTVQGITGAQCFVIDASEESGPRRVVQYAFASNADLESYLAGPAETMRRAAQETFGDQFDVSRRILQPSTAEARTPNPASTCANCNAPLAGQYCGSCGQRAASRLISVWELIRDAFGDLFELDSRIWRTLIPLMIRPGQLTRDYLRGRRMRFMPPFRTYLVLSIVFFLAAFFDPREEFGFFFGDFADEATNASVSSDTTQVRRAQEQPVSQQGTTLGESNADAADNETADDAGDSDADRFCAGIEAGDWQSVAPDWLTPERLRSVCERVAADDGKAFSTKLLDNVPAALIMLLPLMALVLKILYPLSKRYYVEHLLFVVHFHAFVFLILTLQILFSKLTSLVGLESTVSAVTSVAVTFYIPIYFYKALRNVYRQSWPVTLLKYLVLALGYAGGLQAILLLTAVFAAFSL